MPETYTVQSKKRPAVDRSQPIVSPSGLGNTGNSQPDTASPSEIVTPTPSATKPGVRRIKSLHKPKTLTEPFLIRDPKTKRYVSLAASDPKKRSARDDFGRTGKDSVCRVIFSNESSKRQGFSNNNNAGGSNNNGGRNHANETALTSKFESLENRNFFSESDSNHDLSVFQKRRKLSSNNNYDTRVDAIASFSATTTKTEDAGLQASLSENNKVEETEAKVTGLKVGEAEDTSVSDL